MMWRARKRAQRGGEEKGGGGRRGGAHIRRGPNPRAHYDYALYVMRNRSSGGNFSFPRGLRAPTPCSPTTPEVSTAPTSSATQNGRGKKRAAAARNRFLFAPFPQPRLPWNPKHREKRDESALHVAYSDLFNALSRGSVGQASASDDCADGRFIHGGLAQVKLGTPALSSIG